MPLLRGMARTAVIAGTATSVSNRVSRRQANKWAGQEAQEAPPQGYAEPPPPAPAPQDDKLDKLKQLGELKASGVLTEEEFAAEKAKVMAG